MTIGALLAACTHPAESNPLVDVKAALPALENVVFEMLEDKVLRASLTPDVDVGPDVKFRLDTEPTNGIVALADDGNFTYTPKPNFNGSDGFSFVVQVGDGVSTVLTASITIEAVNDIPVVADVSLSVTEEGTIVFSADDLLAGATDVDGDELTVVNVDDLLVTGLVTSLSAGQYSFDARGRFDFLAADVIFVDSIQFLVSDGTVEKSATIHVSVEGVNDLPSAAFFAVTVSEDSLQHDIQLGAGTIVDPDGDPVQVQYFSVPATGALSQVNATTLRFVAAGTFDALGVGQFAQVAVTYVVADSHNAVTVGTVAVSIQGVNDAPKYSGTHFTDGCLPGESISVAMEWFDAEYDPVTTFVKNSCGFASSAGALLNGTCALVSPACTIRVAFSDGMDTTISPVLTIFDNSVRYVALDSAGRGNGSGWNHATDSVVDAIASAGPAGATSIWLKKGTYLAPSNGDLLADLSGGLSLLGSFDGSETHPTQRKIDARSTVLSGDVNGNGAVDNGDGRLVLLDTNSMLDGVTLRHAWGSSNPGALQCYDATAIAVSNVIVRDNHGGPGIFGAAFLSNCHGEFDNVWFVDNVAPSFAGAIFLLNSNLTMKNVGFTGNTKNSATSDASVYAQSGGTVNAYNVFASQRGANAGRTFQLSDGATLNAYHASFGRMSGNLWNLSGTFNLINSAVDQPGFFTGTINRTTSCESTGNLIAETYSGNLFLNTGTACVDAGNNTVGDFTYQVTLDTDWRNLTTHRNEPAILDGAAGDAVDAGYHHDPSRVWINTFNWASLTTMNWETNNNAQSCTITNDRNGSAYVVPSNKLPLGSQPHGITGGGVVKFTMTCEDPNGPWSAEANYTTNVAP